MLLNPKSSGYQLFWKSVFFVIITIGVGLLYYATKEAEYVWRWYRVPQYFIADVEVEVRAEIEGEVAAIEEGPETVQITVAGREGDSETYPAPPGSVRVYEGDFIFPGDVLAAYEETRPGILLQGLWLTLKVSVIAIFFGILIGLLGGLARVSQNPCLRWLSITYIEFIRGSPLLVQIYLWYFVFGTIINNLLAQFRIPQISSLWYGVASLAIFAGAYVAEIVRAGIQSIGRGQTEAARSLGMSYVQSMTHVILPQAFLRILPPLAGQFISLIKDSSLLGIIAIRELTKATREVVSTSLQPYELWFVCAVLYLVLTFALSLFVQYLERRTLI
ncbi:MAG: ABC transporter permease subunit [Desulfococcaceae bacterium]